MSTLGVWDGGEELHPNATANTHTYCRIQTIYHRHPSPDEYAKPTSRPSTFSSR